VLMAGAGDGQQRPRPGEAADLIRSAIWIRLRPSVPRSARTVRAAVRLMYAGAAVTTLSLIISIISLAFIGRRAASLRLLGRSQPFPVAIAVGIMGGLVLIALWLWMARANGQGRNSARILATVLFCLATLHLFGNKGVVQVVFAVLTWVIGLAAVWLLWRPTSNAFFQAAALSRRPGTARSHRRVIPTQYPPPRLGDAHSMPCGREGVPQRAAPGYAAAFRADPRVNSVVGRAAAQRPKERGRLG